MRNTPVGEIPEIPFFENLFPQGPWFGGPALTSTQNMYRFVARRAAGGWDYLDWTFLQDMVDGDGIHPYTDSSSSRCSRGRRPGPSRRSCR
jgi:hypothetical protein